MQSDQNITTAENSPSYSSTFSVVLPSPPLTPTESTFDTAYIPALPPSPTHTPGGYLPNLRPIFPPPPFTPSHPVFAHLSSVAASCSEALRTDAEAYLADRVKEKVAEIEKTEAELRTHVEALWRGFREGVEKAESETGARAAVTRHKDGSNVEATNSKLSPPVTVRDFNPIPSPRKVASPTSAPRISSLSASLATSSFHHPRAQADRVQDFLSHGESTIGQSPRFSPPYLSDPSSSLSSKAYSSLSSPSSKSISIRASVDGPTYLEPFRRNMDQTNDVATSFRYFTILEADTARTQQKAGLAQAEVTKPDNDITEEIEGSTNGNKLERLNGSSSSQKRSKSGDEKAEKVVDEASPKAKRKVTFDVKPDVVTIKREVNGEHKGESAERASEGQRGALINFRLISHVCFAEMIFDLEDEGSDFGISSSNPVLHLNEPPHIPSRPSRNRVVAVGLPSSLSSLRPTSLPSPSVVRPPSVLQTLEDQSQSTATARSLQNSPRGHTTRTKPSDGDNSEDSEPLDPREAEILKLVAADTPSHRGAWRKDSRAWQLFVRRQGGNHQSGGSLIPEETEDDTFAKYADDGSDGDGDSDEQRGKHFFSEIQIQLSTVSLTRSILSLGSGWASYNQANIPASLPISISPLSGPKENLSLASYQPKTSLTDQPDVLVPPLQSRSKPLSSTAWRKAAYAQRDLNRSRDPGPLDFAAEDDDEDEDEPSVDQDGRGRQRALRILQVRSEVPASGMWRSLA